MSKELNRFGKPISFWDGVRVGEFILENFYHEFVSILNVHPELAGSSSGAAIMWDPVEPMVLLSNLSDSAWSNIDVSEAVSPVTASGVFLTVKPTGGTVPPVKCAVKSSVDELLIESFSNQYNPYLLKLEPGDTSVDIRFIEGNRPVEILARGYLDLGKATEPLGIQEYRISTSQCDCSKKAPSA